MKKNKKNLAIIDSILDNLGLKVKLDETYNKALYPKTLSKKRFKEIFTQYIQGAYKNYNYTANTIFERKKDLEFFYKAIKNKNYDFNHILKQSSYEILKEHLNKLKEHKNYDSYVSRNYVTVVIDKMECERTTGNFEKSKKLHRAENGHYLINLCVVIGDDKEIYPVESVLYDHECGKTSIDIAKRMVKDCLEIIKDSGIPLNRIRFSADREFLNHKILDLFYDEEFKKIKAVFAAKKNTVIYNKHGCKSNVAELKQKLFEEHIDDFKYSSQLDDWTKRHNKSRYKYFTLIRETNFGIVRIVAFVDSDVELTEKNYKKHIHILINPNANMTAIQMIKTYRGHRWHIEVFHKDLKQNIEIVKSYRGLSFVGLKNHYILRVISYLILVRYKSLKHSWKQSIGKMKRTVAMRM